YRRDRPAATATTTPGASTRQGPGTDEPGTGGPGAVVAGCARPLQESAWTWRSGPDGLIASRETNKRGTGTPRISPSVGSRPPLSLLSSTPPPQPPPRSGEGEKDSPDSFRGG